MPRPPRHALFACLAACLALGGAACSAPTTSNAEFCCDSEESCARFGVDQPRGCSDGFVCAPDIATCVADDCGDGAIAYDEVCDDGNNDNDDGCSGNCKLASCFVPVTHPTIQAAIADASCQEIRVHGGLYVENLQIARDVAISGVGGEPVVLDGSARGSVIDIARGVVTIENLVVRNGLAERGGGIANHGTLTLRDARVEANTALATIGQGGGIFSDGPSLTLEHTDVVDNRAGSFGGAAMHGAAGAGIFNQSGTLSVTGGEISRNAIELEAAGNELQHARVYGGGIASLAGEVTIRDATVAMNSIETSLGATEATLEGAGVYAGTGRLTLERTRITDNKLTANGSQPNAVGAGIHAAALTATDSDLERNALEVFAHDDTRSLAGGVYLVAAQASTLTRTTIAGNLAKVTCPTEGAEVYAGGLASVGGANVDIVDSLVDGNRAEIVGVEHEAAAGGIYWIAPAASVGKLSLLRTTVRRNAVIGHVVQAGGVLASWLSPGSALSVVQSAVTENTLAGVIAARGGGIYAAGGGPAPGAVSLTNTTVSSNVASTTDALAEPAVGGGVYVSVSAGGFALYSSTVARNRAAASGGVEVAVGSARFMNSLLVENVGARPDCQGAVAGDSNLLSSLDGCTLSAALNATTENARIGDLASERGAPATHALLAGSPAIDAATATGCLGPGSALLIVDQRGEPRINNGRCDVGAFEQ